MPMCNMFHSIFCFSRCALCNSKEARVSGSGSGCRVPIYDQIYLVLFAATKSPYLGIHVARKLEI
jgi:hypothetical protein